MAKSRKLSEFFKDRETPGISQTLKQLDRLAGESIGRSRFYSGVDEVRENIEPWMPLFVLPVAKETFKACLHLRPDEVAKGLLAIVRADDEGDMIELANSLDQFVYRTILEEEAWGYESGKARPSLPNSIAKANEIFGAGFYEQGRHGKFRDDDVERLMIKVFGGTANAFWSEAVLKDTPGEKVPIFEQGIAIEPSSLVLYAGAVKALIELNDRKRAAELLARSLDCYHYTAYTTDIDEYLDLGRSLLKEFPDLFSEDAKWVLTETDPRNWARRAGELFNTGEVERADKILNDLCYGIEDYSKSVGAFRKHYEKLGWDWALALCDLRGK